MYVHHPKNTHPKNVEMYLFILWLLWAIALEINQQTNQVDCGHVDLVFGGLLPSYGIKLEAPRQ